MDQELVNKKLKNLFNDFFYIEDSLPCSFDSIDWDSYEDQRSKILEAFPKFLTWKASLKLDLWKLKDAIYWISQAHEDWKNKNMDFLHLLTIQGRGVWDPGVDTPEAYKEALFTFALGSIIMEKFEASPIPEENDHWVIPYDFLTWCSSKGIVLPDLYETFRFQEEINRSFDKSAFQIAKKHLEDLVTRMKKPTLLSLTKDIPQDKERRDARQMKEFLEVVAKVWAKNPYLTKPALLRDPEVIKARGKFIKADGSRKVKSDAYLKKKMSQVAPNQEVRMPGRRPTEMC